jgi:hypothetical protein
VPPSRTELREFAYDTISAVEDVYCELDGRKIIDSPDLSGAIRFRAMAGGFSIHMPADNIGVATCGDAPGEKIVFPSASDGIWMMLAPMPPGEHLIHWRGTFPSRPPFTQGIAYRVIVTP